MSTYEDLKNASDLNINLLDELKPNGVDLLLPHADFETGFGTSGGLIRAQDGTTYYGAYISLT